MISRLVLVFVITRKEISIYYQIITKLSKHESKDECIKCIKEDLSYYEIADKFCIQNYFDIEMHSFKVSQSKR